MIEDLDFIQSTSNLSITLEVDPEEDNFKTFKGLHRSKEEKINKSIFNVIAIASGILINLHPVFIIGIFPLFGVHFIEDQNERIFTQYCKRWKQQIEAKRLVFGAKDEDDLARMLHQL